MGWHYYSMGKQLGPATADELLALIASGQVKANDLVFGPGMTRWVNASDATELLKPQLPSQDQVLNALADKVVVVTSPSIAGFEVLKCIEVVAGECVFGINALKDVVVKLSDVFGGRSETMQTVLRDARKVCMSDLRLEAARVGANAVVSTHISYTELSGSGKSMILLAIVGTAVEISAKSNN